MKNLTKKSMLCFACAMLAAWGLSAAIIASAATTSEKIKSTKQAVEEKKDSLNESRQNVSEIAQAKAQLEGRLEQLNTQLNQVSEQLEQKQEELQTKQQEVESIKEALAVAQATEQDQYESMKKRIQYLYENGNTDILQMVLEGKSFTEILNKADFVRSMTQYDRNMLDEYVNTRTTIESAKVQLESEEQQLQQVVAEIQARKKEIDHLVGETAEEIAKQQQNLEEAEQKALAYEKQLIEQQNTLQALQEREEEEQRILRARAQMNAGAAGAGTLNQDSSGKVTGSSSGYQVQTDKSGYEQAATTGELKLLATIIFCEAGNQPYEGQIAVGSVVMNRINSSLFPNTMLGVLYQKSQFTPVMSGRFAIALANNSATNQCYAAAKEVLNGANNVPNCLFFRTVIPDKAGTIIGDHVFY